ncbi:MAG: hypothetical protein ACE15F_18985 [bacterium]
MMKLFRSRRIQRLLRISIWTAGLLLILVVSIPWILDIPPVRAWLERQAGARLNARITWGSIHWYFQDNLYLSRVRIQAGQAERPVTAAAESVHLLSLLSSDPRGEIKNVEIALGGEHIGSASQISMPMRGGWENSRLEAILRRAVLDIAPLIVDTPPASGKIPPVKLSWLDSVRFTDSRVLGPGWEDQYKWQGVIQIPRDRDIQLNTVITASSGPPENQAIVEAAVKPSLDGIDNIQIQFRRFPFALSGLRPFSVIVDGTASLIPAGENQYQADGRMILHSLAAALSVSATAFLSEATMDTSLLLSPRYQPMSATVSVEHASWIVETPPESKSIIPPGGFILRSAVRDHHLENGFLTWRSDAVGSLDASFDRFPPAGGSTLEARIAVRDRSLACLRDLLKAEWPVPLDTLQGNISLDVQARWRGTALECYAATAWLQDGSYQATAFKIPDASVQAAAQGRAAAASAAVVIETSAPMWGFNAVLHDATITGRAKASLSAATATDPLDATFAILARYDPASGDYSLTLPRAESGFIHSVSGWLRPPGRWAIEGTLPLETGFPALREAYLPPWAGTFEGMGELRIHAQSNDSTNPIRISAAGPDFSFYSLSEPVEFGVQLRDLSLEGRIRRDPAKPSWNAEIRGVTPYLSYMGYDYEWPGQPMVLSVTRAANSTLSLRMLPPGGGEMRLESRPGPVWRITAQGLSVEEWVYPILSQGWKDTDASTLAPLSGNGRMDLELTWSQTKTGPAAQGWADLRIGSFTREDFLHARLQDARVTFPIGYPFTYENLPRKTIEISAATLSWDTGAYRDLAYPIPIARDAITLPTPVVLPLFGGEVQIETARLRLWDTESPRLDGMIRFDHLFLSNLSRLMPLFPAQGSLNGFVEHVVYAGDRFEISGRLELDVFGGKLTVFNIALRKTAGGSRLAGFDLDIERIDLRPLMEYFNFGEMTGVISGRMLGVEVLLPPAGSDGLPLPVRLDIKIHSEGKGGSLGRETLSKIVQLGESSNVAVANLTRKKYEYSRLGFKATLDGDQFRLMGTADGDYLLAHSKNLFANTIGIRLADSNKVLSFQDFWNRLLAQTGRFQSGSLPPPRVTTP